ncbi:MAG: LytR/AlgR family response regulator transcription factor [Saprospiraceae bacterium]
MKQEANLTAVIVDDEKHCIETLSWDLTQYCPHVSVVKTFHKSEEALVELPKIKPDILFIDIEMPKFNGFDVLDKLGDLGSHIVFTTAYSEYAVRAFRYSAIDYLLKPISAEELKLAVSKVQSGPAKTSHAGSLRLLFDSINRLKDDELPSRISLPSSDGYDLVQISDIVRCVSDGSYTTVHTLGGGALTISRNLKQLEESLSAHGFQRVHHQYVVNFQHVKRFSREDGGTLVMCDGSAVLVSRSRREGVLALMR